MTKEVIVYDKKFHEDEIEMIDPMDFLTDDVVTDVFGLPRGTFHVVVTFTPDPNYDPDEE
ncbi:hypothetical protein pEaSNUABM50_00138 [Erwinia phage pEa_SNUABM_50]|uniref:Uncharacterized protein n=3 Tax=Eneladusvirus BF TaxID=2560751 RepID=A0A7L8ZME2_9CAUD|nr:hypothetical protein FDH34_gp140 [Serratia phage BF]QOI71623.1 hypothetical protein pEaSNUABM47_00139 [Erwinia phage pEa_SNUABM_47]QOI72162.1 hypothetical protein pEaSNUABM50_00138 [Erwinia phage pEa_SNUABM_50]QXO11288.1 hypothetical protein pEaSNUABM19_00142 [Erwinia phage pEa_SNUABM_19]QXO11836.1 hypothetical protein pEaSNUABM44_00140 [Erwinia phage pEa_SNUABM_44]QXO12388.1 hypothetical protein pEaSNUABM49_00142 [Erwinia phage pEa_SNUABM_49]